MLRHNLLLIYRNFKRYKSTFFINLIGLSTGMACTLLIFLWVKDELAMDKFHVNDLRLYQVMENRINADGILTSETTFAMLGKTLAEEMPEVEYAASIVSAKWLGSHTLSTDNHDVKATGQYVGADYFRMFSYSLVQGNEALLFADDNSIVISEDLAKKIFNTTQDVVGKSLMFNHDKQFIVSGVFKGTPPRSSQQFDFALSYDGYIKGQGWAQSWGNTGPSTYLLLRHGTDVAQFNEKIADYVKIKTENNITHRTLFLKRYSENYLYGKYENGVLVGGRIEYVKLLSIIAIIILVIACINFMNLSTAKASARIKEVGIKKAVGAGRTTLIFQYLGESMLMTFMSLLLAGIMVWLFLPQFNLITAKQLSLEITSGFLLSCLGIALFTGLVAGSYPALYLSGFSPVTVLKGKLNSSVGEVWARKGLVVFQFILSVILIVSVLVVYKQIEFVQNQNLGYDKDNILLIEREGRTLEEGSLETFLSEIKMIPGIVNASSTSHGMTGHHSGTSGVEWEGKDPEDRTEFENLTVNYDLLETLNIEMLEGRTFSKEFSTDSAGIIFNEAGIAFMGLSDPIGRTVKLWGEERQIIGVVKDFHFESLHENVKPVFFRLAPQATSRFMVRLEAGKERETITALSNFYQQYNEGFTLDFAFLDEDYQAQYEAEQRISSLSKYFAGLAILISCLGLFGLAAFTAEKRTKEIGIRKILGASEWKIIELLSGDFAKIVSLAIIIALPISFYITNSWLEGFAYKIDLEWWYFIGAGLLTMIIALLTVSFQSIRAALMNPVESLRSE